MSVPMGTIRCVGCGWNEDEASAAFTGRGMVCARCHRAAVDADADEMRRQHDPQGPYVPSRRWRPELDPRSESRYAGATLDGALGTLAARGLTPERTGVRSTVAAHGGARPASGYREVWTLPRVTLSAGDAMGGYRAASVASTVVVRATFAAEGLTARFVKLFRSELQTGDEVFDQAVYVRTDTPGTTAALLARYDVRERIGDVVASNGRVAIDGCTVQGEALWLDEEAGPHAQDLVARLCLALLDG